MIKASNPRNPKQKQKTVGTLLGFPNKFAQELKATPSCTFVLYCVILMYSHWHKQISQVVDPWRTDMD